MCYSRKNSNGKPWNSTSFLINLWKFHMLFLWYPWKFHFLLFFFWNSLFVTLTLEILENTKLQLCIFHIVVWLTLDIPRQNTNTDRWEFHMIFSRSLLEIPLLFKLTRGISTCSFFNILGNYIPSNLSPGFSQSPPSISQKFAHSHPPGKIPPSRLPPINFYPLPPKVNSPH